MTDPTRAVEGGAVNDRFEIGEVAIYVKPGSPHYGKECVVISNLMRSATRLFDHVTGETNPNAGYLGYQIECEWRGNWPRFWARPEWLRKKKPRRELDQIVKWADCHWRPRKVTA